MRVEVDGEGVVVAHVDRLPGGAEVSGWLHRLGAKTHQDLRESIKEAFTRVANDFSPFPKCADTKQL